MCLKFKNTTVDTSHGRGATSSNSATYIFTQVCNQLHIPIQAPIVFFNDYNNKSKEVMIDKYYIDFLYKNIICEYQGDVFHPNPTYYSEAYLDSNWNNPQYPNWRDKYLYDRTKIQFLKSSGFHVIELWSSFPHHSNISQLISFINLNSI